MASYKVGQSVELNDGRKGTVMYIGEIHVSEGDFVGLELPNDTGKNDGSVSGRRYFSTKPNRGLFVRPTGISKVISQSPTKPAAKLAPKPRPSSTIAATKPRASIVPSKAPNNPIRSPPSPTKKTARASVFGAAPTTKPPPRRLSTIPPKQSTTTTSTASTIRTGTVTSAQVDELRAKVTILEKRHHEDRERLARLEDLQTERDKFENIIQKLNTKLQPIHHENSELRRQLEDLKEKVQRLEKQEQEYEFTLENVTLDREMAEEQADAATNENETLKQRLQEVELELDIAKAEAEEFSTEMTPEEKQSAGWLSLSRENERIKDALMRLRDITKEAEMDMKEQIQSLEEDVADMETMKKEKTEKDSEIALLRASVLNLREQLDASIGAEDIIEELSDQNNTYKEKVTSLQLVIDDLTDMKELSDELEANHIEHAKELREEIEMKDLELARYTKMNVQHEAAIADRDEIIAKFRDAVYDMQIDMAEAKSSQTVTVAEKEEVATRIHELMDVNKQLRTASTTTKAKTIEADMLKLQADQAKEELEIVHVYHPHGMVDSDAGSIRSYLRLKRVEQKSSTVLTHVRDRLSGRNVETAFDSLTEKSTASDVLELLFHIGMDSERLWKSMQRSTLEQFVKFQAAEHDLEPVERTLDTCLSAIKTDSFKETAVVDELGRSLRVVRNLTSIHENVIQANGDEEYLHRSKSIRCGFDYLSHSWSLLLETIRTHYNEVETHDTLFESLRFFEDESQQGAYWASKLTGIVQEHYSNGLCPSWDDDSKSRLSQSQTSLQGTVEAAKDFSKNFCTSADKSAVGTDIPMSSTQLRRDLDRFARVAFPHVTADNWMDEIAQDLQALKESVHHFYELAIPLENTKEIEQASSPWSLRSKELEAVELRHQETADELQKWKAEAHQKAIRVRRLEQMTDEQDLRIETLEAKLQNQSQQAGSLQQVQTELETAQTSIRSLKSDKAAQSTRIQDLEEENARLRSAVPTDEKLQNIANTGTENKAFADDMSKASGDAIYRMMRLEYIFHEWNKANNTLRSHERYDTAQADLQFLRFRFGSLQETARKVSESSEKEVTLAREQYRAKRTSQDSSVAENPRTSTYGSRSKASTASTAQPLELKPASRNPLLWTPVKEQPKAIVDEMVEEYGSDWEGYSLPQGTVYGSDEEDDWDSDEGFSEAIF